MWKDGKQHGEGKYVLANGVSRRGNWVEGNREKWLEAAVKVKGLTNQSLETATNSLMISKMDSLNSYNRASQLGPSKNLSPYE